MQFVVTTTVLTTKCSVSWSVMGHVIITLQSGAGFYLQLSSGQFRADHPFPIAPRIELETKHTTYYKWAYKHLVKLNPSGSQTNLMWPGNSMNAYTRGREITTLSRRDTILS